MDSTRLVDRIVLIAGVKQFCCVERSLIVLPSVITLILIEPSISIKQDHVIALMASGDQSNNVLTVKHQTKKFRGHLQSDQCVLRLLLSN